MNLIVFKNYILISVGLSSGETAQELRAEDLDSLLSTHIRWLGTTCTLSSRGSDAPPRFPQALHACTYAIPPHACIIR